VPNDDLDIESLFAAKLAEHYKSQDPQPSTTIPDLESPSPLKPPQPIAQRPKIEFTGPKIRSDNPPPPTPEQVLKEKQASQKAAFYRRTSIQAGIAFVVLILLAKAILGASSWVPMLILLAGFICVTYLMREQDRYSDNVAAAEKPWKMTTYNTEFLVPLATRMYAAITVFFEMPYYFDALETTQQQLNRVTENILIPYCRPLKDPPDRLDLQELLQHALVQFQNEHGIPILRLNVPIVLHKDLNPPMKTVHV
jgi:hypothetical protein